MNVCVQGCPYICLYVCTYIYVCVHTMHTPECVCAIYRGYRPIAEWSAYIIQRIIMLFPSTLYSPYICTRSIMEDICKQGNRMYFDIAALLGAGPLN